MNEHEERLYDIGNNVYHCTPESPMGIVISWRMYYDGRYEYYVTWGPNEGDWYTKNEIVRNKVF